MKIAYHKNFLKHFKKRIVSNKKLESKFYQRLSLFIKNPNSPILRRHQLRGKKRFYWSFSVTGDTRVVYKIKEKTLFFI